ncbi:flavonoid 3'-monooxygenase-like [Selaginella moellendorffii]|nr:flavonoid 3'-monooxygenase-like [Selaginella moellendorffii]|eukprot:XP_024516015.1 flavonoid 3'-monooxygenase-like [Selaginella moellendorffii]
MEVFLLLLVVITFGFFLRARNMNNILPPGPLAIPFVGHLHLLLKGHPHVVLKALAEKYGPVLFLRFGVVPVVVVSSSQSAVEFLKVQDKVFTSRPRFLSAGRLLLGFDGEDMVFAPYGMRWKQLRRLCTTKLFTARNFADVRMSEVRSLVRAIQAFGEASPNSALDLRTKFKHLTFNIITRMLMSKRYFEGDTTDAKEAEEFIYLMEESFSLAGAFPVSDYLPYSFVKWLNMNQDDRIKTLSVRSRQFVDKIITEHELRSPTCSDDFLGLLLKLRSTEDVLQRNTIRGLMINLLQAATDTSSVSLEWTLAELINHPACMSMVQDEIASVVGSNRMVEERDISKLPYLQAIVKESLRLHPPGPLLLPRECSKTCEVMGYKIPEATTLMVNAYAIGRDPKVWKEPLKFKPERFLDYSCFDVGGNNLDVIPFGAGSRACPGISIAFSILHLALANLVHAFHWTLPAEVVHVDTSSEKYGLTVTLAKKLEAIPLCKIDTIVCGTE